MGGPAIATPPRSYYLRGKNCAKQMRTRVGKELTMAWSLGGGRMSKTRVQGDKKSTNSATLVKRYIGGGNQGSHSSSRTQVKKTRGRKVRGKKRFNPTSKTPLAKKNRLTVHPGRELLSCRRKPGLA